MITCHRAFFEARAHERGYSIDEVMPCVVKQDGDSWTIDTDHPAYPRDMSMMHDYAPPVAAGGLWVYRCKLCGHGVATAGKPAPAVCPAKPVRHSEHPLPAGAGTELKALLGRIGIKSTPSCSCNRRARDMDAKGIQWCRDNIDLIAGDWLAGEAKKRGLPYSVMVGKKLVQLAIALAERKAAKAGN